MVRKVVHVIIVKDDEFAVLPDNKSLGSDGNCCSRCESIDEIDGADHTENMSDTSNKIKQADINEAKDAEDGDMMLLVNGQKINFSSSKLGSRNKNFESVTSINSVASLIQSVESSPKSVHSSDSSSPANSCCQGCSKKKKSIDVTDGPATDKIIDSFLKLTFLKILFIDMGISIGDTLTDIVQGFNLIWDFSAGNLRYGTFYYGIGVISTMWMPVIVTLAHLWFSQEYNFLVDMGFAKASVSLLIFIIFFPFMPSLFYLHLLCQRKRTAKQRERYKLLEKRAHDTKSISGSVESPIQLIILFWLMLRGILTIPWDEPLSTSCVEDDLGRAACFPSIPMASMIFSILSIMKSVFDLNISPILVNSNNYMETLRQSVEVFLRFFPFFITNIIFRICSFAFIGIFLDYWSIIPAIILFCFNLSFFGISFTRSRTKKIDLDDENNTHLPLTHLSTRDLSRPRCPPVDNYQSIGWNSNIVPRSPPSYRADPIGWNSNITIISPVTPIEEDIPKNALWPLHSEDNPAMVFDDKKITVPSLHPSTLQYINQNISDLQQTHQQPSSLQLTNQHPKALQHYNQQPRSLQPTDLNLSALQQTSQHSSAYQQMQSILSGVSSVNTDTPSYINEDNTSIFLNSFSGLFFPSCHTQIRPMETAISVNLDSVSEKNSLGHRLDNLITWQRKIFRNQVFFFNTLLLLVILVVIILVTSVETFNYSANILNPFWFNMASAFLIIMWIFTILMALEPDTLRVISNVKRFLREFVWFGSPPKETLDKPDGEASKNQSTQFVDNISIDNTSQNFGQKNLICRNSFFCILVTVIIFVPAILGLIMFKYHERPTPYIYFVQGGTSPTSGLHMTILTAFPIFSFNYNKSEVIMGIIDNECFVNEHSNFTDMVLVINQTSPKCSVLLEEPNIIENIQRSNAAAVVLLDNTPEFRWRVSSNYHLNRNSQYLTSTVPFLMLRQSDWIKFSSYLSHEGNKLFISFSHTNHLDVASILQCTPSSLVQVGSLESNSKPNTKGGTGCSEGKHLYDNGTVSEQVCVESECWTLGQRCPQSYFENLRKFDVNLMCDQKSLDGRSLDFKSARSEEILKPASLSVSGVESEYCCRTSQGSSTFLEVLGQGCFSKARDVVRFLGQCSFTPYTRGRCEKELRRVWRVCSVPGQGCVIREWYNTPCNTNTTLGLCVGSRLQCVD